MATEPDFDWSQAESLLGDDPHQVPEDMAAIVLELIQSGNERFQELKTKNPAEERKGISALAHQLRGSLLNFGFTGVGAILLRIEKQEYVPEEYQSLLDQAQTIFELSKKMLAERFPSAHIA